MTFRTEIFQKIQMNKWIWGDFRVPQRSRWELRCFVYYSTSSGNFLLTFRDNLSAAFSRINNPKENLFSQYEVYIGKIVGGEKSK